MQFRALLRWWEGESIRSIAQEFRICESAVKNRLMRARRRIRARGLCVPDRREVIPIVYR
jgi:predicted RNA polymerase sigma factor